MSEPVVELSKEEKIVEAKELYSKGSRNFLVKSYDEAADQLSQVCALYEELYGELCDELGMPYLLYAKTLIALSIEENKVLDVQDEQEEDDDDGDNEEENKENDSNGNGKLETVKESENEKGEASSSKEALPETDATATSTENGTVAPTEDIEDDAATNLQLAWETLELASRIFSRQGLNALPNLAEVQTELGNIQFENQILDEARSDYEKALQIYKDLPNTYRRATAEIHYKIGLTFLMQQMSDEGANELEEACALIDAEIEDIKKKKDLTEKDENNIKDMEEIKQEIIAKVQEIKETKEQSKEEVRAALDNFMNPVPKKSVDVSGAGSSFDPSSETVSTEVAKPKDITHLIKRKKPENSEDVPSSPAKKPTIEKN
ncbi:NASP family protein [Megaselia abdita]